MEVMYGISGVMTLAALAAALRFGIRNLLGQRTGSDDHSWMDDDPNSTLSVTREVVGEQLDRRRSELLTSRG